MPGGTATFAEPTSVERIEAPVTLKAYLMCAFAAFGGIFFGYDSGYINGIMGMQFFIHEFAPRGQEAVSAVMPASLKALIVSILSVGTFLGALSAGDIADWQGRRITIIFGCQIFIVGASLQCSAVTWRVLVAGRFIAGLGVGFVSAVIILYMAEIAPRKIRGAVVSAYQFCVTIGLMLASVVTYATQHLENSVSYRLPIGIQLVWAGILIIGLTFLPETPRYFVRKGRHDKAACSLARLRGQPKESEYIQQELAEIIANYQYEVEVTPQGGYFATWANCFRGSIRRQDSNLRRTILGASLQMMQQFTGVNFIFYYSTTFFSQLHLGIDPFLLSLITTLVNVFSTPVSFWTIEKFGRRPLLIWGALGMVICQYIVAISGTVAGSNKDIVKVEIAFVMAYVFMFASTWGPGAWVVIGEVFNLPIRSRGIAISTASNWFWNAIIAVITPLMVDHDKGNLKQRVFFVWGTLCAICLVYSYMLVPETKGLTLEQVDRMLEETNPRSSPRWKPDTDNMYSVRRNRASVSGNGGSEKKYDEDVSKQRDCATK